MIIRLIVVDPAPRDPEHDLIVYQVPEKSRAHELLVEMLDDQHLEWTSITSNPRKKRKRK